MRSQQYTEQLTLREMKCSIGENEFGYIFPQADLPSLEKVESLLKKAGGKPNQCAINEFILTSKGKAKPEYIITFNDESKTIIVIECKKHPNKNETENKITNR